MNTRIISIIIVFFTLNAFAQKKEIKSATKEVENGNYDEAKSLLKQVENTYTNEKTSLQSTYLITKGNAYLGDINSLDTPFEDLKVAAESFKKAQELGIDKEEYSQGLTNLKAKFINSAIEDQNKEKHMLSSNKLYEAYKIESDTLYLYYAASSAVAGKDYTKALEYYESLLDMNYDGSETLLQATNVQTNKVENFPNATLRNISIKSGSHTKPIDKKTPSKTGQIAKNISLIYIELDQPEKAKQALERAKKENPNDVGLLQAEADLYYNLGDIESYNKIMSTIALKNPSDPIVFYNLGVSAEKLEDFESAKKYYEKSIEIDPKLTNSYLNIVGLIQRDVNLIIEEMNDLGGFGNDDKYDELKANKIDTERKAIPYLNKVIELEPSNIDAMKYLKSIYYQIGENDKAKELDEMIKSNE